MTRLRRCAVTCVFLILLSTIRADKCDGSDKVSQGQDCRATEANLLTTYDKRAIQNETCLCVCCHPRKPKKRTRCKYTDGKESCEDSCVCSAHPTLDSTLGSPLTNSSINEPKKCVSTEWLTENNMLDGALASLGESTVLCPTHLPGLPCATPGHILRVCTGDGKGSNKCHLETYRELCGWKDSSVCQSAVMEVSRLRHEVPWSSVREVLPDGSTVELTSLSHNGGSIDKFAAHATNIAIKYKMGYLADWLQKTVMRIVDYELPKKCMSIFSRNSKST